MRQLLRTVIAFFIYVEVPVFIVQIEDQNTFLNIFKKKTFYLYSDVSHI